MSIEPIPDNIHPLYRKQRLDWYENRIRTHAKGLASVFIELRNDALQPWRISHASYEDYCREVWGMTPRRIQQIAAGESVKALLASEAPDIAPIVQAMPEGQIRELVTAPPEKRAEVVRMAATQPGKMTASKIKQAKARIIATEENLPMHTQGEPANFPPAARVCPHCHGTGRIQ